MVARALHLLLAALLAVGGDALALNLDVRVSSDLRQRLEAGPHALRLTGEQVPLLEPDRVGAFYLRRTHRPAWIERGRVSPQADAVLALIRDAEFEGLTGGGYHRSAISDALVLAREAVVSSPRRLSDLELLLTDAWLAYGAHVQGRRVDPRSVEPDWGWERAMPDLAQVLSAGLAEGRPAAALQALAPSHPEYTRLREALIEQLYVARAGGWPMVGQGPKLRLGDRGPRVRSLRARLRATGDLAAEPVGGEALFDAELGVAVRAFQRRHGLDVDGIVGARTLAALNVPARERVRQITLNMERWRWLPEDLGRRHIVVNLPAFRLRVVEDGRTILSSAVVVGRPKRPTPVLRGSIAYLVLNPHWHVPWTIAVKDFLPRLQEDAYALLDQGFRVFDTWNDDVEVDPGSVEWSAVGQQDFHFWLRQDPGPRNALGRVKFMFPNRHHVYLHDTAVPQLFERTRRAYSSGCIRVSRAMDLAEYLLEGSPRWDRERLESLADFSRERTVPLPDEVPVHLLYLTAWVDEDGTLQFRDDFYGRDRLLAMAMDGRQGRSDLQVALGRRP